MAYNLSISSLRPFASLFVVAALLSCALVSCGGGGGGGGGSSEPLTEEEKAEAKVEAELSPDDRDVPEEVVPESFQGKRLYEVLLEVKGQGFAGLAAPTMSFRLLPGGDVSDGCMQNGNESVRVVSASWEGGSPGDGAEAISILSITGTSDDGRAVEVVMDNISITSKTVNGQQTTYTGNILVGQCTLGGVLWLSFLSGSTECTMTYYVSAGGAP